MKNKHILIVLALAVFACLVVLNQYVIRFYFDTNLIGALTSSEILTYEMTNFQHLKILYFIYTISVCLALFIGIFIFRKINLLPSEGERVISTPLKAFIGCSAIVALTGLMISVSLGSETVGQDTIRFYWIGLTYIMFVAIAAISYAFINGYTVMLRDWIIHVYGMLLLPALIFPMTILWFHTLNFTIHEAMITAVTISFTGQFFISHFITVQLLGHRMKNN